MTEFLSYIRYYLFLKTLLHSYASVFMSVATNIKWKYSYLGISLKYELVKYAHALITINDTQILLNVKYRFKHFAHHFPRNGLSLCFCACPFYSLAILWFYAILWFCEWFIEAFTFSEWFIEEFLWFYVIQVIHMPGFFSFSEELTSNQKKVTIWWKSHALKQHSFVGFFFPQMKIFVWESNNFFFLSCSWTVKLKRTLFLNITNRLRQFE